MVAYAHTIERTLKNYAHNYNIATFVETGTFNGKTTHIASKIFDHVYTIELSQKLYKAANKKLKDIPNVTCLHGDSASVLSSLVGVLKEDTIFFLDAHWAGELSSRGNSDSPLLEELAILANRNETFNDLIIIDDISFFEKKGEFTYTDQKSDYFPKGGIFIWDWTNISIEKVLTLFPTKQFTICDDRLFIGIRKP